MEDYSLCFALSTSAVCTRLDQTAILRPPVTLPVKSCLVHILTRAVFFFFFKSQGMSKLQRSVLLSLEYRHKRKKIWHTMIFHHISFGGYVLILGLTARQGDWRRSWRRWWMQTYDYQRRSAQLSLAKGKHNFRWHLPTVIHSCVFYGGGINSRGPGAIYIFKNSSWNHFTYPTAINSYCP